MSLTYYSTGLASVANGATTVTFGGAILGTADDPAVQGGDLFADPAQPEIPPQRIASIDYDAGTATLAVGWPGTTMDGDAYEIRFVNDGVRVTAQTRRLLERLQNTYGLTPNAIVADLDARDAYDDEDEGFVVLVADYDGDGGAGFYRMGSGGSADWGPVVRLSGATVSQVLAALGVTGITVSTENPSGGIDGQLWFKVAE